MQYDPAGRWPPSLSCNLPPDAGADLDHAVPVDDEFLRKWRPARRADETLENARRQHTDFFHAPGCYAETTNFADPPENMSPVNAKLFDVFKERFNKNIAITRDLRGQLTVKTSDYTFFRLKLMPVEATDTAQSQEWLVQPLEKYKAKAVSPIKVKMELLTPPKVPTSNSVVFIRTLDSRVTPDVFLDNQSLAQGFRTKAVAKALTGIQAISIVHAELLIDAAIERDIISARMDAQQSLSGFWKLPVELRGRIYQLAADAEGDIWPLDLRTYHLRHKDVVYDKLCHAVEHREHAIHGNNLIFSNGLILPISLACLLPASTIVSYRDYTDQINSVAINSEDPKTFTTPALLRTSKSVRDEVLKVLFVQPTFCFYRLTQLHDFMRNTPPDALSSLRKMRLRMDLEDLLIIFSVARAHLTSSELDALKSLLGHHKTRAPATQPRHRSLGRGDFPLPCEKLFAENDAVFVERSDSMRFTHLSLQVESVTSRARPSDVMSHIHPRDHLADHLKPLQLGRLLLVKLVNLTLDLWAQQSGDRPTLTLLWPEGVHADQVEALDIMNKVYLTTEVNDE